MCMSYSCVLCKSYLCRIIKAMHTLSKVNLAHCACDAHAQVQYFGAAGYGVVEVWPKTGIGEVATKEANRGVTEELRCSEATQTMPPRKRKA